MKYIVKVVSLGLVSQPIKCDTREEADALAAQLWGVPGMVPMVEEEESTDA